MQKASYNPSKASVWNRRRGCVGAQGSEGHSPQNKKNSPERGPELWVIDEFREQRFIRRLTFPSSSFPNRSLFSRPALEAARSFPSTRGNRHRKPTICPFHSTGMFNPNGRPARLAESPQTGGLLEVDAIQAAILRAGANKRQLENLLVKC